MNDKVEETSDVEALKAIISEQVAKCVSSEMKVLYKQIEDMRDQAKNSFGAGGNIIKAAGSLNKEKRGTNMGCIIRSLCKAKGDPIRAAEFAEKDFGNEAVAKALSASDGAAGGFLVPEEFSEEIIELLQPRAVVRRMGPMIIPMPTGNMNMSKLNTGSTAGYISENQNAPNTQPIFGNVKLSTKKLAAFVPVSNDLIRFSNPKADVIIRDDLVNTLAKREDIAFIRDDGTNDTPRGLRFWAPANNVFDADGANTLASVTNDLFAAIELLESADVPMIRPGWLFTPRTKNFIMSLRDGNGNFVYRDEMLQGLLLGWPFATTTQIPNNLGGGSDESEIYFVDFSTAMIGESVNLILDISTEASYDDGTGTLFSAFQKDQTIIRAIAQHDFVMRHEEGVVVITAVTWSNS